MHVCVCNHQTSHSKRELLGWVAGAVVVAKALRLLRSGVLLSVALLRRVSTLLGRVTLLAVPLLGGIVLGVPLLARV